MIFSLQTRHALSVARIHRKELAGDFLPSLGLGFLTSLYKGVLEKPGIYGWGYFENKKLLGFVVGADSIGVFFRRALTAQLLNLIYFLCMGLIQKPELFKKVLETFLYSNKEKGPDAELVVIAVRSDQQGKGIGKKLVQALEKSFKDKSIIEYKVTVHADKNAVFFYEGLGYNRTSSFGLYDKMWYVYTKSLKNSTNVKTPKMEHRLP